MPEAASTLLTINVTGQDGEACELQADGEIALMEVLRDAGLVDAVCGGAMACGTCMIDLDGEWADRLPAPSDGEAALVASIDAGEGLNPRLSCQICLDASLDGLKVRVLEAEL